MTEPATPMLTEITRLAETVHANPLYPPDAILIRTDSAGPSDPLTAAIAHHIAESGSVFLELPGGRLTIVLNLDGRAWIARSCDEGLRR
jgi:hypothetical protein